MVTTEPRTYVQARWFIRRDLPEVLAIDYEQFNRPWFESDYVSVLRTRDCIGMVAEHNKQVLGVMVYELHKSHLKLLRFAVHPAHEREGVGMQMVQRLKDKLSPERRKAIEVDVPESLLGAQMFFRSQGFIALGVNGDAWDEEDVYEFEYRIGE